MKKKIVSITIDVIIWIFLLGFAAIVLIPLAFMFTASFMPSNEIMKCHILGFRVSLGGRIIGRR